MLCGVTRTLVHIRSASVAEPGTRKSDEDPLWDASGYLPFSKARIGSFFQDRPVLKNPFLEDALLRGYLRRHLPEEVRGGALQLLLENISMISSVHIMLSTDAPYYPR